MEEQPTETLYSLTGAQDAPGSEQGEQHLTLFRVGSLLTGEQRDLCLVKKVSRSGALIRAYNKLRAGQKVNLELKGQHPIEGTVAWANGTETRILFKQAIDVLQLLKVCPGGRRRGCRESTSGHSRAFARARWFIALSSTTSPKGASAPSAMPSCKSARTRL